MNLKCYVSTGYVGCAQEETISLLDYEDLETLEAMTEEDLENFCQEVYMEWLWNNINTGWHIEE